MKSPVEFLKSKYTLDEMAAELWSVTKLNIKLHDRNNELEVANFWLRVELEKHDKETIERKAKEAAGS